MMGANVRKQKLRQLQEQRDQIVRDQAHRRARRMELLQKHAPAEWMNRLTEEIEEADRLLAQIDRQTDSLRNGGGEGR